MKGDRMVYGTIALKLLVGLLGLFIVIQLLGKRELSRLTPFDFIYALILGGIVEEGLYDKRVDIWHILFALFIWGLVFYMIEILTAKSNKMKKFLRGTPSIIIYDGEMDLKEMKKNHLDIQQLRTMMRKQGVFTLREVRDLYIEPCGTVSIKKYTKASAVTPSMLGLEAKEEASSLLFIEEGRINEETLLAAKKTKKWLEEQLAKKGYEQLENILYGEWSETNGFYVKPYR